MKTICLSTTNTEFPIIGLGTWQAKSDELEIALETALNIGYRHIDTAFNYNNEEAIGRVIKKWLNKNNINRSELFITTKLPNCANRADDVEKFLRLSLNRLELEYIDLYLIHVPFGFILNETSLTPRVDSDGNYELDLSTDHIALWKAMESVMNKGLTKNIGLSNFNKEQIDKIYQRATIKPQVLQVECHAYLQQEDLRLFCAEKNIAVTAYSPLGSPGSQNHFMSKYNYELQNLSDVLGHPVVQKIASDHGKNAAQILLNYLVRNNVSVIPKSSNPQRIKENFEIFDFELMSNEVKQIKGLDKGDKGRIIDFYFWKGAEKHPHYPF